MSPFLDPKNKNSPLSGSNQYRHPSHWSKLPQDLLGRLEAGLKGVRRPYVKFPRNPQL
jgi:hypothetical protein